MGQVPGKENFLKDFMIPCQYMTSTGLYNTKTFNTASIEDMDWARWEYIETTGITGLATITTTLARTTIPMMDCSQYLNYMDPLYGEYAGHTSSYTGGGNHCMTYTYTGKETRGAAEMVATSGFIPITTNMTDSPLCLWSGMKLKWYDDQSDSVGTVSIYTSDGKEYIITDYNLNSYKYFTDFDYYSGSNSTRLYIGPQIKLPNNNAGGMISNMYLGGTHTFRYTANTRQITTSTRYYTRSSTSGTEYETRESSYDTYAVTNSYSVKTHFTITTYTFAPYVVKALSVSQTDILASGGTNTYNYQVGREMGLIQSGYWLNNIMHVGFGCVRNEIKTRTNSKYETSERDTLFGNRPFYEEPWMYPYLTRLPRPNEIHPENNNSWIENARAQLLVSAGGADAVIQYTSYRVINSTVTRYAGSYITGQQYGYKQHYAPILYLQKYLNGSVFGTNGANYYSNYAITVTTSGYIVTLCTDTSIFDGKTEISATLRNYEVNIGNASTSEWFCIDEDLHNYTLWSHSSQRSNRSLFVYNELSNVIHTIKSNDFPTNLLTNNEDHMFLHSYTKSTNQLYSRGHDFAESDFVSSYTTNTMDIANLLALKDPYILDSTMIIQSKDIIRDIGNSVFNGTRCQIVTFTRAPHMFSRYFRESYLSRYMDARENTDNKFYDRLSSYQWFYDNYFSPIEQQFLLTILNTNAEYNKIAIRNNTYAVPAFFDATQTAKYITTITLDHPILPMYTDSFYTYESEVLDDISKTGTSRALLDIEADKWCNIPSFFDAFFYSQPKRSASYLYQSNASSHVSSYASKWDSMSFKQRFRTSPFSRTEFNVLSKNVISHEVWVEESSVSFNGFEGGPIDYVNDNGYNIGNTFYKSLSTINNSSERMYYDCINRISMDPLRSFSSNIRVGYTYAYRSYDNGGAFENVSTVDQYSANVQILTTVMFMNGEGLQTSRPYLWKISAPDNAYTINWPNNLVVAKCKATISNASLAYDYFKGGLYPQESAINFGGSDGALVLLADDDEYIDITHSFATNKGNFSVSIIPLDNIAIREGYTYPKDIRDIHTYQSTIPYLPIRTTTSFAHRNIVKGHDGRYTIAIYVSNTGTALPWAQIDVNVAYNETEGYRHAALGYPWISFFDYFHNDGEYYTVPTKDRFYDNKDIICILPSLTTWTSGIILSNSVPMFNGTCKSAYNEFTWDNTSFRHKSFYNLQTNMYTRFSSEMTKRDSYTFTNTNARFYDYYSELDINYAIGSVGFYGHKLNLCFSTEVQTSYNLKCNNTTVHFVTDIQSYFNASTYKVPAMPCYNESNVSTRYSYDHSAWYNDFNYTYLPAPKTAYSINHDGADQNHFNGQVYIKDTLASTQFQIGSTYANSLSTHINNLAQYAFVKNNIRSLRFNSTHRFRAMIENYMQYSYIYDQMMHIYYCGGQFFPAGKMFYQNRTTTFYSRMLAFLTKTNSTGMTYESQFNFTASASYSSFVLSSADYLFDTQNTGYYYTQAYSIRNSIITDLRDYFKESMWFPNNARFYQNSDNYHMSYWGPVGFDEKRIFSSAFQYIAFYTEASSPADVDKKIYLETGRENILYETSYFNPVPLCTTVTTTKEIDETLSTGYYTRESTSATRYLTRSSTYRTEYDVTYVSGYSTFTTYYNLFDNENNFAYLVYENNAQINRYLSNYYNNYNSIFSMLGWDYATPPGVTSTD